MTLCLIGIGLNDEKDISVKGLERVKGCDKVYLENYTSVLECDVKKLEKFYGKKIIIANRETAEQGAEEIVKEAKNKDVAFLIIGDVFGATTHIELFRLAKNRNVPVEVINNASILTAVGITGLQLYKFGKVTSIPFYEEYLNLETPYNVLKENKRMGLHTLFLLDLDLNPGSERFVTVNDALEILEKIETKKKEKLINKDMLAVGCARLGGENFVVKKGTLEELKGFDFGKPPHCLIIPGKLHFMEEEVLELWK